jgi:hypothetical protein
MLDPGAGTSTMSLRRFAIALGIIAIVAFGIRVAFVNSEGRQALTAGDSSFYFHITLQIVDGEGYNRPYDLHADPPERLATAEHPPLFPLVLAVPAALGFRSLHDLEIASSLIGVLTVVMVGLLGRRVVGAGAGVVAAGIAAIYPMFFQPSGLLFSEPLFEALVIGALLLTYDLLERSTTRRWILLGVVIGLAALTRGEGLLLLAVLAGPLIWRHASHWRERLKPALLVGVATLIVVAPWMIRNAVEFDAFVPISTNTSTAIAGANCHDAYNGPRTGAWDFICTLAAAYHENDRKPFAPGMDEVERLALGSRYGLDYMANHLDRLPVVLPSRVLRTWGLWDLSELADYDQRDNGVRTWLVPGYIMFLVMIPLGVGGAVVLRRRGRRVWPLAGPMVIVTVASLVLHGATRFRAGAEPSVIVFASAGVLALCAVMATRVRSREREPSGLSA